MCGPEVIVNLRYIYIHRMVLANPIYIHSVYIWFWPTLLISERHLFLQIGEGAPPIQFSKPS